MERRELPVPDGLAGERADAALAKLLGFSRTFAAEVLEAGGAQLDGAQLGKSDRLFREPGFGVGHVVDFLQIWGFPAIFNGADIAVVSSMGLFILLSLRGVGLDGTRTPMVKTTAKPGA